MYDLMATTYTKQGKVIIEKIKVMGKEYAEQLADEYYDCINVHQVEVTDSFTGELVYYHAKK